MKNFTKAVLLLLTSLGLSLSAQNADGNAPFWVGQAETVTTMPSIASRTNLLPSEEKEGQVQDGRASKYVIVPGKGNSNADALALNKHRTAGAIPGKTPSLVFETAQTNSSPTDPSGALGPNHYFAVFNTGFRIFDKNGTALTGQLGVGNIFPAPGCCDLTVSYDNLADRWVVSFLNGAGAGIQIAVSNGPDPLTTDWTVYNFPQVSDYNKLSVWRDGYYITENTGGSNKLWVLERDFDASGAPNPAAQMAGFALPGIITSGFHSPQAMNITDDNHPTTGGCPIVYMQDDAWAGVSEDHVKVWLATMDWDNTANSSVSQPLEIALTPFIGVFDNGNFVNLTQPNGNAGGDIDALQATVMNQGQFRKFGSHNSLVFNWVVDTDATAGELAGIRWVELRQPTDSGTWSLYQEGTYTAPGGKHAWNASLAMDGQGNIGMGYVGMAGPDTPTDGSEQLVVSSYYTARFAADALGTMTIDEELIAKGNGNIPNFRYSDYSKIDVDPSNNKEFWYVTEYIGLAGGRADVVGVFQIAPNFANDVGIISIDSPVDGILTAAEDVTVTIFNFGENDATGFDVTYAVNGGALVTETFTGTLASSTSAQFTFSTQADLSAVGQTYTIESCTALTGDEDAGNDCFTGTVTNLNPNDVGVTAITAPTSASGLSDAETVTVEITNFGGATQTSIPVFYALDGGTPVSETYTGSIASGESDTYSFTATIDLSVLGTYVLDAGTELSGDADTSNDDATTTINNFFCQPVANCAGFNDGVTMLALADQDLVVDCDATSEGYSDNTDIVFTFNLDSDNPFDGVLQMGWVDSIYAIWIDFNDNSAFDPDEVVSSEQVANADTDFAFTIDFADFPNATTGNHLMRVRGEDESGNGDVLEPCDDLQFGRTNDYTANIVGTLSTLDPMFEEASFTVNNTGNDIFDVQLITEFDGLIGLRVYNTLGQEIVYYNLNKAGDRYQYELDMSYVSAGVYIVQMGDLKGENIRTQKIVVR